MAIPRRTLILSGALTLLVVSGSCVVLNRPTTTLQAIDGRVTAHTIPLYVKAIDFIQRHYQYELLVSNICREGATDVECVSAIFEWTHKNISPTPPGWPVVDSHPLTIIIRGHGKSDQIADVFTTLSTYAGVRAFFSHIRDSASGADIVLSFARVDGDWVPFDVERHVTFRDSKGRLASIETLVNDPAMVEGATEGVLPDDLSYSTFISPARLMPFVAPRWSHADLQRPWSRAQYELRRLIGRESESN